ncbi:MAG: hypothetical protein NTV52_08445 [Acidobacteria bacterium]|nr:hypothetical protein [Acidobacteriota bacterium]
MTAYAHPDIDQADGRVSWGASGSRDLIWEQIGSTVTEAWATELEVSVGFESGTVVSVSTEDEDYMGPEAIQFISEDVSWWVG